MPIEPYIVVTFCLLAVKKNAELIVYEAEVVKVAEKRRLSITAPDAKKPK